MRRVTTRRKALATLASGVASAVLLAACNPPSGAPTRPGTSAATRGGVSGLRCSSPGTPVWLGASSRDVSPGRFTVTSGTYQLAGRDFAPPAPVPILPTDLTAVVLGPGSTTPTFDRQRATVAHSSMTVRVGKAAPAVVRLDAGSYWVLNSLGVSLKLSPCDGGRISGVSFPTGRLTPTTPPTSTGTR